MDLLSLRHTDRLDATSVVVPGNLAIARIGRRLKAIENLPDVGIALDVRNGPCSNICFTAPEESQRTVRLQHRIGSALIRGDCLPDPGPGPGRGVGIIIVAQLLRGLGRDRRAALQLPFAAGDLGRRQGQDRSLLKLEVPIGSEGSIFSAPSGNIRTSRGSSLSE